MKLITKEQFNEQIKRGPWFVAGGDVLKRDHVPGAVEKLIESHRILDNHPNQIMLYTEKEQNPLEVIRLSEKAEQFFNDGNYYGFVFPHDEVYGICVYVVDGDFIPVE